MFNNTSKPPEEPVGSPEEEAKSEHGSDNEDELENDLEDLEMIPLDDREPKLFVDVNVANFGLKRIIVYEGDTVDSLVSDFVKRCPIEEPMVERLRELLKKQMDGVLERIDEDDYNPEEEDEPNYPREHQSPSSERPYAASPE